ncbi:MAG: nuclear transport factor 2 family protein [Planctomycetota bacterium]
MNESVSAGEHHLKGQQNYGAPSHAAEIETIKAAYAALNRGDIAGFVKDFDPEIVRVEPSDFPGGGTYHGIEAVKAHVALHRGNWAEGGCEPQKFTVVGDKILVSVQVRVRLKSETSWREGRVGDVFSFRNGKATLFRTFFDEGQAFEWAGDKAPKP